MTTPTPQGFAKAELAIPSIKRYTPKSKRLELIAEWQASGLTQKAFGAQYGIRPQKLTRWIAELKASKELGVSPTQRATVKATAKSAQLIQLRSPAGYQLTISQDSDLEFVKRLLEILKD
jgi:transposase-like protein